MRITARQLRQIIKEELAREMAPAAGGLGARGGGSMSGVVGGVVGETAYEDDAMEGYEGYGMEEDYMGEMGMYGSYDYDLYESQRGNDENSQHDNDTQPGDPYARKLKESRRLRRRV